MVLYTVYKTWSVINRTKQVTSFPASCKENSVIVYISFPSIPATVILTGLALTFFLFRASPLLWSIITTVIISQDKQTTPVSEPVRSLEGFISLRKKWSFSHHSRTSGFHVGEPLTTMIRRKSKPMRWWQCSTPGKSLEMSNWLLYAWCEIRLRSRKNSSKEC